ncbi:lamin tail domain-containing protein [candidate division KSB1 bacterium]|nr:lamin tail domain-containing protein [candidate division KSB1 bacterium]
MKIWLLFILYPGILAAQVVLNEIMFNPAGNERTDEYIELVNITIGDTVDMAGWLLSDGSKYCALTSWQEGSTLLAPGQYAVVLLPGYTESQIYEPYIPEKTRRLSIDQSAFGAYGLSNSSSEPVGLFTPDTVQISAWEYSVPNNDGYSEEKKALLRGDFDFNWDDSRIQGGTPGFENSNRPLDFDLALQPSGVRFTPHTPHRGDTLVFTVVIYNLGTEPLEYFRFVMTDSLPPVGSVTILADTLIETGRFTWPDSFIFYKNLINLPAGDHFMSVYLEEKNDMQKDNNTVRIPVTVLPRFGDVVLNEIFACFPDGFSRWFELYNAGPVSVDLKNWRFYYQSGEKYKKLSPENYRFDAGEYVLLCENETDMHSKYPGIKTLRLSSFPDLSGGSVYLRNENGFTMDSCDVPQMPSLLCSGSWERRQNTTEDFVPCPHPMGATPGEKNAAGQNFSDLALLPRSINYTLPEPALFWDVQLDIKIYNWGNLPSENFDLLLYRIDGQDTLAAFSDTFSRPIQPGDSVHTLVPLNDLKPARHDFFLKLKTLPAPYRFNNSFGFSITLPFPNACIVLNELMYDTDNKNMEYIELYNPQQVTVDLKDWHIRDRTKTATLTSESFLVDAGGYAVISRQPLDVQDPHINLVLEELPDLNNTGDDIVLLDFTGHVIDSLSYSQDMGGGRNISLERYRFEDDTDKTGNWGTCRADGGGTPGLLNSISPKQFDAALVAQSLSFSPKKPQTGQDMTFYVTVVNSGRRTLSDTRVRFFARPVAETEFTWICTSPNIHQLEPRDSCRISATWLSIPAGVFEICVVAQQQMDQVSYNDSLKILVTSGYTGGVVVLNEIMYSPASGKGEWIEIFNRSDEPVELRGWSVADADTNKAVFLSDFSRVLNPGQYGVIGLDTVYLSDSALKIPVKSPSLSNNADTLWLRDGTGTVIDRLFYENSMGGLTGYSLERISPDTDTNERSNWTTCVNKDGHTAGRENSVYTRIVPSDIRISVSPDPFSPDGDGVDDVTAVLYRCPALTVNVNIKIYDILGRLVRFLQNNHPSGSQRTVFWDGRNDQGQRCKMGIYIVLLQAMDRSRKVVHQAKTTVVLALPL